MKLDDLEAQVLGHTRREMTPSPEDARRVRRALAIRLGAAALGTAANASAAGGFWASLGAAKTTLLVLTALGGGAAALGWSARAVDAPSPVAPTNTRSADPAPKLEPRARPARAEEKAPSTRAAPALDQPLPRRAAPVPSVAAGQAQTNDLANEVRLLKRADQALRKGTPELARRLLDELSRSYPNGQLLEERAATETLLACQQGRDPRAQRAAREFLSAHPASVYAARIRAACLESSGDE